MGMRHLVLLAAVVGLATCACGSGEAEINVAQAPAETSEFAERLGACSGIVDGPPIESVLTRPGSWYRIEAPEVSISEDPTQPSTLTATAEYLGGDEEMADAGRAAAASSSTPFLASASTVHLMADAVELAQDTYVKAEPANGVAQVIYPLAFDGDGDFAFVGECKLDRYTLPLTERLGTGAADAMRQIVGADSATTRGLLGLDTTETTQTTSGSPGAPALNPQFSDPELLSRLLLGEITLEAPPDSWLGPYTICPRIDEGWSPCFDLQASPPSEASMLFISPTNPVVELWLADQNANLSTPLARIGVINLAAEVDAVQPEGTSPGGTVSLTVALPAGVPVDEAAAGPDHQDIAHISAEVRQG